MVLVYTSSPYAKPTLHSLAPPHLRHVARAHATSEYTQYTQQTNIVYTLHAEACLIVYKNQCRAPVK